MYNLKQFNYKIKQNIVSIQKETNEYENVYGRVIRAYGELNKMDSAFYFLDSLNKCVSPNYLYYFYPEFNSLFNNNNYIKYYKPYLDSIKTINKNLNTDFYTKLLKLEMAQWLYMRILFDYRFTINKNYSSYLKEKQFNIKEYSLLQLDSLILLYGVPTKEQITTDGLEYIHKLIMQKKENSPLNTNLLYILLKEKIININLYSTIIDKNLIYSNCPQKYGTQYWFDDTSQQYYYYPIDDLQHIDKTRKQIGLYPINEQNKSIGLKEIQIKSNGIQY